MELRDIVAVYGAALSSLLAAIKFFEGRPILYISPDPSGDESVALIQVKNPGKWPLQMSGNYSVRSGNKTLYVTPQGFGSDGLPASAIEDLFGGTWSIYIAPGLNHAIQVANIEQDTNSIICLKWHRHGLLPPRPIWRRIRAARIAGMNRGVIAGNPDGPPAGPR